MRILFPNFADFINILNHLVLCSKVEDMLIIISFVQSLWSFACSPGFMWVSSRCSGFFTSHIHASRRIGWASLFPRCECVLKQSLAYNWRSTIMYSYLVPSDSGMGSGSTATLVRMKHLLKINESISLILIIYFVISWKLLNISMTHTVLRGVLSICVQLTNPYCSFPT